MRNVFTQRRSWLFVLLAVLWISAEVRYRQMRHKLATLQIATILVRAVDESSGVILPTTIGGIPGYSAYSDYLPHVIVSARRDGYQMLTIVSDEPLTLAISSQGYLEQPLTIGHSSEITVRLKKK